VVAAAGTAKPEEPRTAITNRVSPLGDSPHLGEPGTFFSTFYLI
jgi:hypothetical protein